MKATLEELYQQYGQISAQRGDLDYQVGRYQFRIKQLARVQAQLQKDIGKLQGKNPSSENPALEPDAAPTLSTDEALNG